MCSAFGCQQMQLHSSQGQADTNPEKLQVLDADARIFLFEGFLTPGGPACQYVRGQQPSSSDAALYPGLPHEFQALEPCLLMFS